MTSYTIFFLPMVSLLILDFVRHYSRHNDQNLCNRQMCFGRRFLEKIPRSTGLNKIKICQEAFEASVYQGSQEQSRRDKFKIVSQNLKYIH